MNNYQDIKEQFDKIIKYSQEVEDINTDKLFKNWLKGKEKFIETFGGLTYEFPEEFTFSMEEDEKINSFEMFVTDAVVYADEGLEDQLSNFLSAQGLEGIYNNRVINPYKNGKIRIEKNAKISKSLKFFFKNDKEALDAFQTRLSRMIQECKVTGKIVFSVHPLDFLSISENAHNWHSCHALDGEYRTGNLSYMQDSCTFIVYLKADGEYNLPNFPEDIKWNSKKWRVLMYTNKDNSIFVKGREYPLSNQTCISKVTEVLGKIYNLNDFSTSWKNINDKIGMVMEDSLGSLQYNDCILSLSYEPEAIWKEGFIFSKENQDKMIVGDGVECLICGENMVSMTSSVCCQECGGYTVCEHCGEAVYEDEMYYLDGDRICEYCWDEEATLCAGCDETFNSYSVNMMYDTETDQYYCPSCFDKLIEKRQSEE